MERVLVFSDLLPSWTPSRTSHGGERNSMNKKDWHSTLLWPLRAMICSQLWANTSFYFPFSTLLIKTASFKPDSCLAWSAPKHCCECPECFSFLLKGRTEPTCWVTCRFVHCIYSRNEQNYYWTWTHWWFNLDKIIITKFLLWSYFKCHSSFPPIVS